MNDRSQNGCIGNGISVSENDLENLSCNSQLAHGLGLPATSIVQVSSGGNGGLGDRLAFPPTIFDDPSCGFAGPSPGWGAGSHNFLEFSSETPHQLGWYLVTLATEYELLRQNGESVEAQRTLEDLFLALQAYRRLDITANCLVKQRYDEITDHFEVENCLELEPFGNRVYPYCLCGEKYHNKQCDQDNTWFSTNNDHMDIPAKENCPWQPDLSGYSGFFIRSDATQEQESLNYAKNIQETRST
ncbi:MAG: hypothetical protein JNJ57_20800 [Saprospiraceae bacterium]|nr:hypothetical protein [Saprospiraceae bacterium]